jgi:two-component system, sensor histidine kinase and response regulator
MWMRLSGTVAGRQAAGSTILIGEDFTEQVAAREAQEEARAQAEEEARAKSSFLASMSHEIRTPMNGILGMIELLLDTDMTEDQRSSIQVVKSSADGLLRILNDVLDVSKIEAGQLDLESIDFQLHDLLSETARVFGPQAGGKGVELLVDVNASVPVFVRGDPVRLRQIVTKLLSNAVKFTGQGEIVLAVENLGPVHNGAEILFSVRDTGIGIAEGNQQKVFGEFEQADQSTTRVHGGKGLGLTISRRLVEIMGGTLELKSEFGVGSDFHFTLTMPVSDSARPDTSRGGVVSLEGKRVLIVDDNETARKISRHRFDCARVSRRAGPHSRGRHERLLVEAVHATRPVRDR